MSPMFYLIAGVAVATLTGAAIGVCAWWVSPSARARRWQEGLRRDLSRRRHPAGNAQPKPLPKRRYRRRIRPARVHALVATEWPHLLACLNGQHCHEDDGMGAHFDRLADEVAPDTAKEFDGGTP